ncbi:CAAX protease self-immunity [uncultured archaeon]|nr:CAAX protease self-immunity [uncultured archaeon]
MDSRTDRNNGITKSIIFYAVLTLVVLVSMYFYAISAALVAYSIIILIAYLLKKQEGGFRWGVSWKFGFLYGLILISSIFFIELIFGWIKLEELSSDAIYILAGAVIFELLVSIGEEMSFRGYILPNLIKSIGRRDAVIATSLLFAMLHAPSILLLGLGKFNEFIMFATITAAGIILALLYLTDGLKMSSAYHFSWNFFQYHIFSLRGGFGIFGLTAAKPELTGGLVGPEAGLLGLFVLIVGILVLLVIAPLRKE